MSKIKELSGFTKVPFVIFVMFFWFSSNAISTFFLNTYNFHVLHITPNKNAFRIFCFVFNNLVNHYLRIMLCKQFHPFLLTPKCTKNDKISWFSCYKIYFTHLYHDTLLNIVCAILILHQKSFSCWPNDWESEEFFMSFLTEENRRKWKNIYRVDIVFSKRRIGSRFT